MKKTWSDVVWKALCGDFNWDHQISADEMEDAVVNAEEAYATLTKEDVAMALACCNGMSINLRAFWIYDIFRALSVLESPLERAFFSALMPVLVSGQCDEIGVVIGDHLFTIPVCKGMPDRFLIQLQPQVLDYRPDLKITHLEKWDNQAFESSVIIELDGHDFHERTKEQASRDKKKDRDYQRNGFTIFRYSGSDIWRDPIKPIQEITQHLRRQIHRKQKDAFEARRK